MGVVNEPPSVGASVWKRLRAMPLNHSAALVALVLWVFAFIVGLTVGGLENAYGITGFLQAVGYVATACVWLGILGWAIAFLAWLTRSRSSPAYFAPASMVPAAKFESVPAAPLSIEERRAILQREIGAYLSRGFHVVSQTETTAQLIKPKQFSCFWATFWLLMLVIGLIIYLFYYASQRDQSVYIEVDQYGHIVRR